MLMSLGRRLIVNADDFGRSSGINRGIIRSRENGIVTSTSLMVRWPAAEAAAEYARQHPALSVGLHVDLSEWSYVGDEWRRIYEVVPVDDADAVAKEIAHQLNLFRKLTGREPSHLDSHQHVHRSEPVLSALRGVAEQLAAPLRSIDSRVRYNGAFYGQSNIGDSHPIGISVDGLIQSIRSLPPGVTELGCHPGDGDDIESMYRAERLVESQTLCDPRVGAAIEEESVILCSFLDYCDGVPG